MSWQEGIENVSVKVCPFLSRSFLLSLSPSFPSFHLSLLHKSLHSLGEVSHFSQGTKKEHLRIQEGSLRNTSGPVCLANGLGTVKRTLLCNLDQTRETGALVLFPSGLQAWQGHLLGGYPFSQTPYVLNCLCLLAEDLLYSFARIGWQRITTWVA